MKIDRNKVNLSEADIEEYLWRNPGAVTVNMYIDRQPIARWLKRQLAIPSGKLDLFGETEGGTLAVVEVKNVEVDSRAVAQVCRYAFDMKRIMCRINRLLSSEISVRKVIVGPAIADVAFRECEACDVEYIEFSVNLSLRTASPVWTDSYLTKRQEEWDELGKDETLRNTAQYNEQSRAYAAYETKARAAEREAQRRTEAENEAEERAISDAIEDYLIKKSSREEPDE